MRGRVAGSLLLVVLVVLPVWRAPVATVGAAEQAVVAFGGDVNLGRWQNTITARDGPARALEGVP